MKRQFKYLSVVVMFACLFCVTCMYAVGGGTLSYIDSAYAAETQEIQAESSSFIGRIFDFVSGIFSWFIDTFGSVLGRILGTLGIGTPSLFLFWIVTSTIKSILFHKSKKIVEDKFGLNQPKPVYKRELDKYEIMMIGEEYGLSSGEGPGKSSYGIPSDEKVYCSTQWAGSTWHGVALCETGIYTYTGLFSPSHDYLSYFDLRNSDYMDMSYLKIHFEGFPAKFYNLLMHLKEA